MTIISIVENSRKWMSATWYRQDSGLNEIKHFILPPLQFQTLLVISRNQVLSIVQKSCTLGNTFKKYIHFQNSHSTFYLQVILNTKMLL